MKIRNVKIITTLCIISYYINISVNTKHLENTCTMLDQRRRRWADVVQMLYKCFVFGGMASIYVICVWVDQS